MHTNSTEIIQHNKEVTNASEEVEKYFPGFMAFIDCTEQQTPRPIDNKRRKAFYSGKKKRYTVKTQLMVNNQGIIIHNKI